MQSIEMSAKTKEEAIEAALTTGKDETELVIGYIENGKRNVKSKGEIITVAGAEYVVPAAAYKYTYNTLGRKDTIEVSDFMYDYADYCELLFNDKDELTGNANTIPVLLRIVEDDVVDVYGSNKVVEIKAPQALVDAWEEENKKD